MTASVATPTLPRRRSSSWEGGELHLDDGIRPVAAGDVVVLSEGTPHDLVNMGSEVLRVVGFFAAPAVNQHFDDVMLPPNSHALGSPNASY